MGGHIGVVVRQGEFWHSALAQVGAGSYGYALGEVLTLFTEPLLTRGVRALEEFLWHDPGELEQWIARLEAQGLDAARPRQLLAQVRTQRDWHSPADGLVSVRVALEVVQAVMAHRAASNSFPSLETALDSLQADLEAIARVLQRAHTDRAQFRLQHFD